MRKFLLILFATSAFITLNVRGENYEFEISYDSSQFVITTDSAGYASISSTELPLTWGNDTLAPALPYRSISVALPPDVEVTGCTAESLSRSLLCSDVTINPNPVFVAMDDDYQPSVMANYSDGLYPSVRLEHSYDIHTEAATIANFRICPFEYESADGNLYFIDNRRISIDYKPIPEESIVRFRPDEDDELYFEQNVINYPSEGISLCSAPATSISLEVGDLPAPNYIIITSEALKDSFKQLAEWKTVKGVPTEIVSVEDIYQRYSKALDEAASIKQYIKDQYTHNKNLNYVQLGGDDTIVPVRYCYGNTGFIGIGLAQTDSLATDLYYACLSGNINWDSNGNNKFGEVVDDADLNIQVNVSRLPIRTIDDIKAYTARIISYEYEPQSSNATINKGPDKFLISGSRLILGDDISLENLMAQEISSVIDSL